LATQQFAFVTQCRVATHHLGNAGLDPVTAVADAVAHVKAVAAIAVAGAVAAGEQQQP